MCFNWYKKASMDKDIDVDYCETQEDYVKEIAQQIKELLNLPVESKMLKIKDRESEDPDKICKIFVGNAGDIKVYLVNGNEIKKKIFMDFIEGGNDMIYGWKNDKYHPKFIPMEEVWVDADVDISSFPYILVHELVERHLMSEGMEYDSAHEKANGVEKMLRSKECFSKK